MSWSRITLVYLLLGGVGCAWNPPIRQRRDAALERRDDPPRHELRSLDLPPPVPLVNDTLRVYGDPQQNQDGGLELHAAFVEGLKNSRIARVVEGSTVNAAPITGYDVDAFEARKQAALAAFDTSLSANFLTTRFRQPPNAFFGPGLAEPTLRDQMYYGFGFTKPLTTGGQATLFYDPAPAYLFLPQGNSSGFNPTHVSATTMALRQPLLRGAGVDVVSVPIQVAQLQHEQSAWDFKKEVLLTCRNIADAYWDLHAARAALKAIDEILPLLEEAVDLQQKAFDAERSIYADVAKARSQLFLYRQQRVELQSRTMAAELRLRNLMGLPPADGWNIVPVTAPLKALPPLDPERSLAEALLNQPDIARQKLNVAIRQKQLLVAQNGLLPQLDFEALYRMNGLGENLGDALAQMSTNAYADWQLGATFSVPLGRRQAAANLRASELQFARERELLEQSRFSTAHQLGDVLRQIRLDYAQFHEAEQRLSSADEWLKGTRLRYQNPLPVGDGQNWLFQFLNDYLLAVRFRTDSAIELATLVANYNADLVRLEQVKGTLLNRYEIYFAYDPCRQVHVLEEQSGAAAPQGEEVLPPTPSRTPAAPLPHVPDGPLPPAAALPEPILHLPAVPELEIQRLPGTET